MRPERITEQRSLPNEAIQASEPKVRMSELLAATLKSRNGDTLNDLNKRLAAATEKKALARQKYLEAEYALRPLSDAHERAVSEEMNIRTRLNIWWRENRQKYDAANAELRRGSEERK